MFFKKLSVIFISTILSGCMYNQHKHPVEQNDTVTLGRYYKDKRIPLYNQKYIQIAKYRSVLNAKREYNDVMAEDYLGHNNPQDKYKSMYLKMARNDIRDRNQNEAKYLDIYIKEIGLDTDIKNFYEEEQRKVEKEKAPEIKKEPKLEKKTTQETNAKDIQGWYYNPPVDAAIQTNNQETSNNQ